MLWALCVGIGCATALWLLRRRDRLARPVWWTALFVPLLAAVGAVVLWPSWLILRKGVALLLMPAGLVWLGLMVAAFLTERSRLRHLLVVLLIGYTLAGNPWVGTVLLGTLERRYPHVRPADVGGVYDAVFVLGGGSGTTPMGDPQLAPSGDRVRLAAALFRAGKARTLVTSGAGFDDRDLAAETRRLWLQLGVPDEAILELPGALNTGQEIERYAELLRARDWDRVGLVTSARHMWRAQALCQRLGLKMDPLPADFRAGSAPPSFLGLIPQGAGFETVEMAGWEYLGTLSVRLTGS